jgi:hypothetical protein
LSAALFTLVLNLSSGAQAMTIQSQGTATVSPEGVIEVLSAANTVTLRIEIAAVADRSSGALPEIYWIKDAPKTFIIAEKSAGAGSGAAPLVWADSRACPSLTVLASLLNDKTGGDPLPASVPKGSRGAFVLAVPADGPIPARSLEAPEGGPLAVRVNAALKDVSDCWSDWRPQIS